MGFRHLTQNGLLPSLSPSIDANDFDELAHPILRQVDAAGVSSRLDFLFDHLQTGEPELGLGGLAPNFRLPAHFFQVHFSFQGDHILPWLAQQVDFFSSGPSQRCVRLAPAEFPMTRGWLCKATEFVYDFTDDACRHVLSYKVTTI